LLGSVRGLLSNRRRVRSALQGKGLVAEHRLDYDVASRFGVYRVLRDKVAAFGDDLIGILHDLELFEAVILVQPHALADDFEDVADTNRSIALVRGHLEMIRMIDREECVDARVARGMKLVELQFAFEGGKHAEIDALQADRRLL